MKFFKNHNLRLFIIQGRYNEDLQHYVKRKRGFEDFVQG